MNLRKLRIMRKWVFVVVLVAALGLVILTDAARIRVSSGARKTSSERVSDGASCFGSSVEVEQQFDFDANPLPDQEEAVTTPAVYNYMIWNTWGGYWCDAEKTWWDPHDDLMCWAAVASNILEWSGWGKVAGMTTTDDMFQHFQDHWIDQGGAGQYGWHWWIDGTIPGPGCVDVPGGGNFWSSYDFWNYFRVEYDDDRALETIDDYLHDGYGVYLSVNGHAITCWGFNYNPSYAPSDPNYYEGIWVTDSDNTKNKIFFPNRDTIQYYEVTKSGGRWYLQDYYGGNSDYIHRVEGFGAGPGISPRVDAGPDKTGILEGNRVYFSGDFVNPGARWTHSYKWDFGDGTPVVTGRLNPSHIFRDDGVYTVTLSVTDEHGDVGTDTLQVTVLDRQPTAKFNWNPLAPVEGYLISFNDLSVSSPVDIVAWSWNFGDSVGTSTVQHPTYSYIEDGTYFVTLTVTDDDGSTATYTTTVTVLNAAPMVNAGSDQTVDEGGAVAFSGWFWDPGILDTHTIEWDFGDGYSVIGSLTPTHIYLENGIYIVTLTVVDDDGGVGTGTIIVTVNNVAPLVDAGQDQDADEGAIVVFMGTFSDPGILDTHTIEWNFGDGSPIITGTLTPTHAFGDNGVYTVLLTVTDDDGGVGTDDLIVTVFNVAPMMTTPLGLNQPNPQFILPVVHILTFTGGFTDPGWLDTHTVTWDFGDGTVVPGIVAEENIEPDATGTATAEHVFTNPGIYTVTMTITDDDGGSVFPTRQVTVVTAKEALFDINQFIQALPENAFKNNPSQRKNAFNNMFLAIATMLDNEAYRGAIEDLRHNIRGKVDGQVDGKPQNDWVIDPEAQQEICMKIDDLIEYLEFLSLNSSSSSASTNLTLTTSTSMTSTKASKKN